MFLFRLIGRHYMLAVTYLLILAAIAVFNWSLVWNLFDNPVHHLVLLAAYILVQRAEYLRSQQTLSVTPVMIGFGLIALVYYIWIMLTGDINMSTGPWRTSGGGFQSLGAHLLASSQFAIIFSLGAWLWARSSKRQPASTDEPKTT